MKKNNLQRKLIHSRLEEILGLIKKGNNVIRIETAVALLLIDVLHTIQTKSLTLKEGCGCFIKIDYALEEKIRKKMSEEFRDLLNEAILLDEVGTAYGPDLNKIQKLAVQVLSKNQVVLTENLKQRA